MFYLFGKSGIYNLNKNKPCDIEDVKKDKRPVCIIDDDNYSLESITDSELKNLKASVSVIPFPPIFSLQNLEPLQEILGFYGKRVYGLSEANAQLVKELSDINSKSVFIPLKGCIFDFNTGVIVENRLSDSVHICSFSDMVYIIYYSATGEVGSTYFKIIEGEDFGSRVAEELTTFLEVNIQREILESPTFGIILNDKNLFNSEKITNLFKSLNIKYFLNETDLSFFNIRSIDRLKYIDIDTLLLRLTKNQVTNYLKFMVLFILIGISFYAYKYYYTNINEDLRKDVKKIENEITELANKNQKLVSDNKILFLRNFINKDLNKIVSVLLSNNIFEVTGYTLYGYEYSGNKIVVFYKREPTYSTYIEPEFIKQVETLLKKYSIVGDIKSSIVFSGSNKLVEFIILLKSEV